MRPDMKHVIVSRPRVGGSKTPRCQAQFRHLCDLEEVDSGPRQEGMRRWHTVYHGWDRKAQTDLLGPLRRFLRSRVGQDWDTIWSAICRHADARDVLGLHLRFHVSVYVAKVSEGEDGQLYDTHGHALSTWHGGFYIDPTTNQLRTLGTRTAHACRADVPKVLAIAGLLLHQHDDGHWYRVKMAVWSGTSILFDCFLKDLSYGNPWTVRERLQAKYGLSPTGDAWYCMHKESANRKDIRQVRKQYNERAAA